MKPARPVRSKLQGGAIAPAVRISNGARSLLIFSYGLFAIAAQSLLFREFITTFEGNDISVGVFFGSWFLWVGLGALLVYRTKTFAEKLLGNIEFLFLGYLPAFILQVILIIQARQIAGIEAYALLSIRTILILSIVVNAPISTITGMLFPIACRWVQQGQKLPVSNVYIIEAAGSFLGGLGVTVLLAVGLSPAKIFFILAFIVSLSTFAVQLAKTRQHSDPVLKKSGRIKTAFTFLVPSCILLCLFLGADKTVMRYIRVVKWSRLLPAEALAGSFQTAQAEYLYGAYRGQWIAVCQGSVIEALPDESITGRIAAISLCQKPDVKNVLVIGSGLGLCRQFLRLPQVEHITWAYCDSEYVRRVDEFIPPALRITDERLYRLAGDIRAYLTVKKQCYDIVIINLHEATTSVLNRYYTFQFYRMLKDSLTSDGILAVRTAGGENIMGTELVSLGASVKLTLGKVFSRLVLTPGEDTWFIASDSKNITGEPGILRDRFAAIKGAGDIFIADALLSVYLPDRAAAALESYSKADLPESLLVNRDSMPLTYLYSLLLAAKQSGAPGARLVKHLVLAGPLAFVIPLLVFAALRFIYILRTSGQGGVSGFDSSFLVFSAGWAGIGVVVVLMYLYQTYFGSLYLHIGVISSAFMMGLTFGAALAKRLLVGTAKPHPEKLLFAAISVNALILLAIAFWPVEQWTHLVFAVAFVLCGLCVGSYFPLAAAQLADAAFETGRAGGKLETADHIGASAGGLLTGLVLVPVLGTKATLLIFILLIAANLPPVVLRVYKPDKICSSDTVAFRLRRLGYVLFGIGAAVVLCSNLLVAAGACLRPLLPQYAAQSLASRLHIEQASAALGDGARKVSYFKVYETEGKVSGYIFSSQELAPEVYGFGGRINLVVHLDTAGKLINFHIIQSNETPSYLELLNRWYGLVNGHQLFIPAPFADVQAVSGATVSSKAVLSVLETSAHRFAAEVLGLALQSDMKQKAHRPSYLPDNCGIYLIAAFVFTLIVTYRGGFWSRLAVLVFDIAIGGIILNAQYSSEQIATILSLHIPAVWLSGALLLVAAVPLMAVFFGNVYCGYICPFGAAQELISYIVPDRFKPSVSVEKMQKARFVKYIVLFVLIVLFFVCRNRTILTADPLISIFNFRFSISNRQSTILLVAVIALLGSLFCSRFWCRYLCPAGAFLSLFNSLALLKRYFPAKRYGRCEFGLTAQDHLDCIYCDRCRYQPKAVLPVAGLREEYFQRLHYAPARLMSRYFVAVVLVIAVFVSAVSINRFLQVVPTGLEQAAVSMSSGGQPRDVDLQRIRTMIDQKKLSDKEAQFYKKIETSPPKITDNPEDKRQDK